MTFMMYNLQIIPWNIAMSFEALADAEYTREKGRDYPDCAWILSDRDVWYKNPWYTGPARPHPDHDDYYD